MDAVTDPATGNIVCRSQIDPNAAFGYYPFLYGTDPNAQARLDQDVAACVPINILGNRVTQDARDYVLNDTVAIGKVSQFNALAFVSGDSSQFFELPGGPIGVVVGAEYREDDLFYNQDEEITLGYTFYNAIPTFEAPKSKVKEAFGEIRIPLLRDLPFFHELEFSAAGRVSDYNLGRTGTVYAYNANAVWSPIRDLRLRGNYARAVRAPNQVELFTPPGANFSLIADPCDVNQVGANPNRASACQAAGIPAGTAIVYSSSLAFLSGGFSELEAEKSDSYTLGGVLTPRFLPGFSFSVDYYDITVKEAISSVTAQFFINQCYDQPAGNPFCTFQRAGASGVGALNNQPFGIIPNSLAIGPVNFAKLTARGLDFEVAYRNRIGDLGRLDTRLTYTRALERTNYLNPLLPEQGNRVLSELGDPRDAFNWNTSFQRGRFTLGYQMRYLGKQVVQFGTLGQYEDFFEFDEACTNGANCPPFNQDFFTSPYFKEKFYHDARLSIDVGRKYNIYMGVDNFTDTQPPLGTTGIGGNSGIYDTRGRYFYAGAVAKF
jgi:outer membrane receptor protein involved in Fe transport